MHDPHDTPAAPETASVNLPALSLATRFEASDFLGANPDDPTLEQPASASSAPTHARSTDHIASFQVRHILGEGGMGIVYCAEQAHPKRLVAIKVLKSHRVNPASLKRFQREVQTLGRLQHPGIAQIYAAGEAQSDGATVPFLAMELVDGLPLSRYAENKKLTRRERLQLLLKVCDAIQHAHNQGVIHRDLKPSNILVTSAGEPKILDFGLSLSNASDPQLHSMITETGQLLGTLAYMSPEQAAQAGKVDLRSDVYSLGIVAYELLAGRRPYNPTLENPLEAMRLICDTNVSRLSSIDHHFRGDVDTIIAKALSKEVAHRYQSVADFAADIRRHLADEPILARPPSLAYRTKKFIVRHKVLVSATLAIVLALTVGLVIAVQQAHIARANARNAEMRLTDSMIAQADALLTNKRIDDARDLYLTAWSRLVQAGQPTIPAELGVWEADKIQTRSLATWKDDDTPPNKLFFSQDGFSSLELTHAGTVRVRDLATGKIRCEVKHNTKITSLALPSDTQNAVTRSEDGEARIWNISDGKVTQTSKMPASNSVLIPSPNGQKIMLLNRVWDVISDKNSLFANGHNINMAAWIDNSRVVLLDYDCSIHLWDIEKDKLIRTLREPTKQFARSLQYSSADHTVHASNGKGSVQRWDLLGHELPALTPGPDQMVILNSGNIAFASDKWLQIKDSRLEKLLARIPLPNHGPFAISPDEKLALLSDTDGKMILHSLAPGLECQQVSTGSDRASELSVSSDGTLACSLSHDHSIRVWDVQTGRIRQILQDDRAEFPPQFSRDNRSLFIVAGCLYQWNMDTHQLQQFPAAPRQSFTSPALPLQDGKNVAVIHNSSQLQIWNINNQECILNFPQHADYAPQYIWQLKEGPFVTSDGSALFMKWTSPKNPPTTLATTNGSVFAELSEGLFASVSDLNHHLITVDARTQLTQEPLTVNSVNLNAILPIEASGCVATLNIGNGVTFWDLQRQRELRFMSDSKLSAAAAASRQRTLLFSADNGNIEFWRLGRPAQDRLLRPVAQAVMEKAKTTPLTSADYLALAQWWEFSALYPIAIECYKQAETLGAPSQSISITRCDELTKPQDIRAIPHWPLKP